MSTLTLSTESTPNLTIVPQDTVAALLDTVGVRTMVGTTGRLWAWLDWERDGQDASHWVEAPRTVAGVMVWVEDALTPVEN